MRTVTSSTSSPRRMPWNRGKLIGAKSPLRLKHVWAIRNTLQLSGRIRDLALFNLGIDSKLRGCDLVTLRVADVAPQGLAVARTTVRQKKTGRPVMFEPTEHTRESVDAYLRNAGRHVSGYLFPGRGGTEPHMSTRQYARLLDAWFAADRPRSSALRHAFSAPDQGDADLQAHRKSQGGPASAWTHQDREHRALSRRREE
jgi:integrase